MSYHNILVAINTNENLKTIVNKGIEIARNHNATLSTIHIDMKFEDFYIGELDFDFEKYDEMARDRSQSDILAKLGDLDYPITNSIICSGDLSNEIIDTIKKNNIDLLIMGHHHYSRLGQFFMSVSAPLIEAMPCDILLIKVTQ
ncbi:universal stress protein [Vibrio gazogenes]|uniref:Universal stress protein n=1 Tax=Vibrio gazogenes DSM 21264 = NBRC 103151 TaxID=1123492 RepID=A0A1M4TYY7_VIBGA|nr:universal stress protein [Vibrio gazogenes]USP16188.1 universal stress protein [Vibrio gazogenes]SHE49547.1 universal stress protein A [Vibrio gazogenes DSM 21264] [Vibrio gazogenes DSM 21264 = NBRC 103151]SJN53083.1 hypothetical protein BQ6471_00245 [Vibrio gazogenes]